MSSLGSNKKRNKHDIDCSEHQENSIRNVLKSTHESSFNQRLLSIREAESRNAGSDIGFLQLGKRSSWKPPCTVQRATDQVKQPKRYTERAFPEMATRTQTSQLGERKFPQCSLKLITIMR